MKKSKKIEMQYYVYVIESEKELTQYVGLSSNPEKRLKDHNRGKVTSTRAKKPWKLVYLSESFDTRIEARKREIYLKSSAGRRVRRQWKSRGYSSVG